MLPDNSHIGIVLVGGGETPDVPISLSEDPCPPCAIDYLQNTMVSLGGEYYTSEAMEVATELLAGQGENEHQMVFHVTHGPPLDESQSPCSLHAIWHLQGYRIITIMDGDVGDMAAIDCSEEEFPFLQASLYFNHTNEYAANLDSIQATTDLPTEACKYDGWYENTYGARPGGFPEFHTLDWMPFNGTLYFNVDVNDWVVDADIGSLLQFNGPDMAHPPWIASWNEYAPEDSTYSVVVDQCLAVQVSCGDPPE